MCACARGGPIQSIPSYPAHFFKSNPSYLIQTILAPSNPTWQEHVRETPRARKPHPKKAKGFKGWKHLPNHGFAPLPRSARANPVRLGACD
eukprot:4815378-Pyramimonas_sp.AAC.1